MSFPIPFGFWKSADDGFRYLHDEISGGLFAYSHLQNKAVFAGDALEITGAGGNAYSFVDGLTPLATIQGDYPSSQDILWPDQIGSNDLTPASSGGWNGTDYSFNGLRKTSASGYSLTFSNPHTTLVVIDMTSAGLGTTQGIIDIYTSSNTYYTMVYAGSDDLLLRKRNGSNSTRSFSGVRNTGVHILIWEDNGSLNSTGTQLYYDDMATARAVAATSGITPDATITANIAMMQCLGGNAARITGCVKEFHQWSGVLNQTQRETAKEILEQYYTFS